MAVQQALVSGSGFGTSITLDFTADFVTHEGGGAGVDPGAGNDLIVIVWTTVGVTGVSTNQSDTGVLDYSPGADFDVYRIADISSGVTDITVTFDASTTPRVFCIEDDSTLTEDENVADTATPEGSSTSHSRAYTTAATSDRLIIATGTAPTNRDWGDASGSSALALDTSERRVVIWKEPASTAAGDVNWTFAVAAACNAGLISYTRAGAAGGPWTISVPLGGTPY